MTRRTFPFSLRITLATFTGSIFTPAAWDVTGTQLLQLKTDRGTQLVLPHPHARPAPTIIETLVTLVTIREFKLPCFKFSQTLILPN